VAETDLEATEPTTKSKSRDSSVLKMAKVAGGLIDVHVEIAKREVDRDRKRLTNAAVGILVGTLFLAMTIVLLEGVAVVAVHDRAHLDWALSFLLVAGVNAVVGGLLVYVASRRMKAPVLPETRSLVKKTFAALTE